MALQVVIIYVGKSAFHIVDNGLSGEQWGICLGFSAITFVVSFIVQLIPIHNFIDRLIKPENEVENNKEENNEEEDKKENIEKVPEGEILSMNDNNKKK